MSTSESLDRAVSIAANAAYCLVVLSLVVLMFPALRRPIAHLARRILYDYRYGVWVGQQPPRAPVPAWVRVAAQPGAALAIERERPAE